MGKFCQVSPELWPLIDVRNWFSLTIFAICQMDKFRHLSKSYGS